MFNIYTVFPRWFCAWVHRAVSMLDEIVNTYKDTIYVNHEIIHNKFIINYFEKKWVIFEENLDNIPVWSIVVISAHWVWPSFMKNLRDKKLKYIDATCPLVKKVHLEAQNFIKNGYKILYIWKKNHQEALWVYDYSRENIFIVSREEDILNLNFSEDTKLALLTQTTLSVDDTKDLISKIKEIYPHVEFPSSSDICYATTNRQTAIKKLSRFVDTIFIVWSKNSSNSNKLKKLWEKLGKKTFLIDDYSDIEDGFLKWSRNIWVSSWASWPEELVKWVVEALKTRWWNFIEEVRVVEEKINFPYDIELKS